MFAYKFRIYPTKEQQEFIKKNFDCARFVYNYYLDKRINAYVSDINLILTAINMKSEGLLKDTKRLFDLSIVVQKANREKCKI